MKINKDFRKLIEEVYLEYKVELKKYRKEITHFTKNGVYHEWKKNNYKDCER